MNSFTSRLVGIFFAFVSTGIARADLEISPQSVTLRGKDARYRLLVTETIAGKKFDRSGEAVYSITPPELVAVNVEGIVSPLNDGTATITAQFNNVKASVTVKVVDSQKLRPVTFERDIEPILARAGCNAGACHGKARGQNGFALSILGFDKDFDYFSITAEAKGRRIFPASPDNSLLLRKGSGQVPHGGGKKLPIDNPLYDRLRRWIIAGCPRTDVSEPTLERVVVEPAERIMGFQSTQQLRVVAVYSDGTSEDVTHLSTFQSNDSVYAAVNTNGQIKTGPLPGEAAIMARYMEKFAVSNIMIPLPTPVADAVYEKLQKNNFIDALVWDKLKRLALTPSQPASDATFQRRLYLDVIGRLPTPDETKNFLANTSKTKRAKLIDALLDRPEYGDWWTSKWADLLRPNPYRVGIKSVFSFDAWLREQFRKNVPYDQFVRDLVTAQGSTFQNGAAVVFRDRREPDEITTLVSQLFLGIRLDCARCHHHPFEVYGQEDFYSFAAYFGRLGHKGVGLSPPISGGEEMLYTKPSGEVRHPVTGKVLPPRPLFGQAQPESIERDPRRNLAQWMTSKDNPFFAKVIVNRVWADLMGRGIVDPVDDLRATNPPTNGPLLDALAADFRANGYDLKKLIRTITSSYVYGLSTEPNERNSGDLRNYSRHYRQRLRAEVLLDAVSDVTGIAEHFEAMPPGSRAVEVWTARSPSVFLDSFGRPDPNQDPPCERTSDTSVVQSLHLMNSTNLHAKVSSDVGRSAQLASSKLTPAEIVDELYLRTFCRKPTASENADAVKRFQSPGKSRRHATEDLLWSLVNSPEFVLND